MTRTEEDRKTRLARQGKSEPKQQQGGAFPIFSPPQTDTFSFQFFYLSASEVMNSSVLLPCSFPSSNFCPSSSLPFLQALLSIPNKIKNKSTSKQNLT